MEPLLKELYNRLYETEDFPTPPDPADFKAMDKKIVKAMEELEELLTREGKRMLEDALSLVEERNALACERDFQAGFSLAARLVRIFLL